MAAQTFITDSHWKPNSFYFLKGKDVDKNAEIVQLAFSLNLENYFVNSGEKIIFLTFSVT